MLRTILAIAVVGCLDLSDVWAAESDGNRRARAKQISSSHRTSGESRVGKASSKKSSRLSRTRKDTSRRDSNAKRRTRNRSHTEGDRDRSRSVDNSFQPDANVVVELPSSEPQDENDNEPENDDDRSVVLLGTAADNEDL
jgi:hypothetical protein